ncbi:hypothetical protein AGMMS4952_15450 [Spirochaetia bacterium]|nr:hypothetical protein AGMMS4952_15450 [Spirochaetia bacterium]
MRGCDNLVLRERPPPPPPTAVGSPESVSEAAATVATPETAPEADFSISTANGQVTITKYRGKAAAVGIPATIGGKPVTSIYRLAFAGTRLTSVSIPVGITSIGDFAFVGTSLTSVSIPTGVTSIGERAFAGTGLTSVSIPASVTRIGNYAFSGCTGPIQVDTNNKNYSSRDGVLFNKTVDTLILCPTGKKGQYAIPATVTSIGGLAFADTGLTSVSIPTGVTSIGDSAFSRCTGLTSILVDTNNTTYSIRGGVLFNKAGDTLILYPAGLKGRYTIPADVTSIGVSAFSGCTGLTSVSIPASVTSIAERAFEGCTGITSVSIPASVANIGMNAFRGCTGITSEQNGFTAITVSGRLWITGYTGKDAAVVIPATIGGKPVISIGTVAFQNRENITSVSIPVGVTSIGERAFYRCWNLTSVSIPASVTSIGDSAFYGCGRLTSVSIPASVTSIGDSAFYGCGLKSIHIPASVTSIGNSAFDGDNEAADGAIHSGLEAITVDPRNASYSSRDGVLFNKTATILVCYPAQRKETLYTIPDGVTRIGSSAFGCYNSNLRALSIPASVTSIDDDAFDGCRGYLSVITVNAVRPPKFGISRYLAAANRTVYVPAASLAAYRSADMWKIFDLLPEMALHVRQMSAGFAIHDRVLVGYSGSAATPVISADWGVTSIGERVFQSCTSLTTINIPAGVTKIDDDAFRDCTGLTSVNIPEGVTSIDYNAFRGCTGLTSIRIPASVTSISMYAFSGCTGLTSINIPANVSLGSSRLSDADAFENKFDAYYNTNGKKAGVYTYRNGAWSFAAQ